MVFYADAALYLWELFKLWTHTIFVTPFDNLNMLWLLVPVWLGWFFAEFFQEKAGTSMGNAITNAVIILWGSIDCTRQTIHLMSIGTLKSQWDIILRFILIGAIFLYGALIVWWGVRGNKVIKYLGRIREVTYVFIMFVPIFYNEIPFSVNHIIAAVLFFPLFYFVIELLDRYTPNPKALLEDMKGENPSEKEKDPFADLPSEEPQTNPYSSPTPTNFNPATSKSYNPSFNNSPKNYNPQPNLNSRPWK